MLTTLPAATEVLVGLNRDHIRAAPTFHCPSDHDPVPAKIETADYEEGDTFSCPECGKNLVMVGADEVEIADDDEDDDDLEDDDDDEDEEEDDLDEDDDDEEEDELDDDEEGLEEEEDFDE